MRNNLFSHEKIASKLVDLISKKTSEDSYVIAINGAWGTGKTHLMQCVLSNLDECEYIKIEFNAWRYSQREEVWRALLVCILDTCRRYVTDEEKTNYLGWTEKEIRTVLELANETERALYTAFIREEPGEVSINTGNLIKTGLNLALKFVPWSGFGSEIINSLFVNYDENGKVVKSTVEKDDIDDIWGIFTRSSIKRNIEKVTGVEQFRKQFEVFVNAILIGEYELNSERMSPHGKKLKLVIAIDDLDRCLPEAALEVLEAIKLFIDFPGVYFMLAMDGNVIQQGLNMRYKQYDISKTRAKDYYEKIIDLSFSIPTIRKEKMCEYIQNITESYNDYCRNFDMYYIAFQSNLRAWQRCVSRTEFNRELIKNIGDSSIFKDTAVLDVFLKLQCLSYQWPEVYEKIHTPDNYIKLEKSCCRISSYESSQLQECVEELKRSSIDIEILNVISDKKIIDFFRINPKVESMQGNDILEIFFTFDKSSI